MSSPTLADHEWVAKLKDEGALPFLDFQHCSHGWASPPGDTFFVRGTDYFDTKSKIPGGQWLLHPLAFDWIKSSSKICNIMKHPSSRVHAALVQASNLRDYSSACDLSAQGGEEAAGSDRPFVWAFNLQLSNKENHSIIMYYVSFTSPKKGSLVQRFLDGDDEFRNSRMKLLCHIPEGPWIVKAAVGEKGAACLIGKKLTCTYTREECYMEIGVDVGSSMAAQVVTQLAMGATAILTVDVAFTLEAITPLELPEQILGAIRFANLNLSNARYLDPSPLSHHNDHLKPGYRNQIWRSLSKLLSSAHPDSVANVEDDGEDYHAAGGKSNGRSDE